MEKILVAGGDLRCAYLANLLSETSAEVYACGFDKEALLSEKVTRCAGLCGMIKDISVVILPLPISLDNECVNAPFSSMALSLRGLFALLKDDTIILGGKSNSVIDEMASAEGLTIIDYFHREDLAVLNTIPTVEGAIGIAMAELPVTIFGTKTLVTGYGRIGRFLSSYLKLLGADVCVAARKYSDRAWIKVNGLTPVHTDDIKESIGEYRLIFNTVPSMLFDDETLLGISEDALMIDLASKPGGVDFSAAKTRGIKIIWALSLPGKVAPLTSGEILRDTILAILSEQGVTL